MKSHLTMLIGDKPSTKHYSIDPITDLPTKGKVEVSYLHESIMLPVENIDDLFASLTYVRSVKNSYIIRGLGLEDYQTKVRRTLYLDEDMKQPNFMEVGNAWICCDFDSYEVPNGVKRTGLEAIEYLIETYLPKQFQDVSYIYQWSASAGLEYKEHEVKGGTSVHLFFYLSELVTNRKFKIWFDKQIKDGFDESTFNTVTPIFVNTEVVKDPRIVDIIPEDDKFGLVGKSSDVVQVPDINVPIEKPMTAATLHSIDNHSKILSGLGSYGIVYRRGQGYYKLWHRNERSKGDWFVYTKNLEVVHHHVKKSMRIDKWLLAFWGIDLDLKFEKFKGTKVAQKLEFENDNIL